MLAVEVEFQYSLVNLWVSYCQTVGVAVNQKVFQYSLVNLWVSYRFGEHAKIRGDDVSVFSGESLGELPHDVMRGVGADGAFQYSLGG